MSPEPPLSPAIGARTPPEAQVYIQALAARVVALEGTVQCVEAAVQPWAAPMQPWQEQGRQDSRTSSRPPSSDPPQALAKRPRREPSGRRPGGQPGHEGHARGLGPGAQVDVGFPVKPERCRRCQPPLPGEDSPPQRHQVTEIPPVKPVVTAYQWHHLVCSACGAATRAEVPSGVPTGGVGPRLQAITALCTGAYHLSKRPTQRALEDLLGIQMGLGTIANLEPAAVHALAEPVAEARVYVPQHPAAYLDETGWRAGQPRAWLWTAVTAGVTVLVIRLSRRGKVARALLGEQGWGWLVTDRWSADTWYPAWRPVCWAHLLRDIDAMPERGGRARERGEALRAQAQQMCQWWQRVREGPWAHRTVASSLWPVRRAGERLLDAGQTCGVPKTAGTCRERLKRRQALWTFVRHDAVQPTNTAAERAIRPGGLWRKGSVGTHRAEGARFVEALMTVVATLNQPHRNVLDSVTAACEAALRGEPAPSFLPTPDVLN